jgi:hypothetical protein
VAFRLADRVERQRLQHLDRTAQSVVRKHFDGTSAVIALCDRLRVAVEGYVHSDWAKIPALVANRLSLFALAVIGILATLRIAFDG